MTMTRGTAITVAWKSFSGAMDRIEPGVYLMPDRDGLHWVRCFGCVYIVAGDRIGPAIAQKEAA